MSVLTSVPECVEWSCGVFWDFDSFHQSSCQLQQPGHVKHAGHKNRTTSSSWKRFTVRTSRSGSDCRGRITLRPSGLRQPRSSHLSHSLAFYPLLHSFFQTLLRFACQVEDVPNNFETFRKRELVHSLLLFLVVLDHHRFARFWFQIPSFYRLGQLLHHLLQVHFACDVVQ